jgi:hypothetical protein
VALESLHAVTYFARPCRHALRDRGLVGFWTGYFAARAAPLGRVGAGPVSAAFFNFEPGMVADAVPGCWEVVDPAALTVVRAVAGSGALGELCSPDARGQAVAALPRLRMASARCSGAGRTLPTLLGLAGIDLEQAAKGVAEHHEEAHSLPGRDLSDILTGNARIIDVAPIYFLTEDEVTSGLDQSNVLSGKPFDNVTPPGKIESVIAALPTGTDGADELWKLNHYYERLDDWYADKGFATNPFAGPAADPVFELHNLSADPEERTNRAGDADRALVKMKAVLDAERDVKRLVPAHRNP